MKYHPNFFWMIFFCTYLKFVYYKIIMKRNLCRLKIVAVILSLIAALSACKTVEPEPPEIKLPEVALQLKNATENILEIEITAKNADKVAYLCLNAGETVPSADAIMKSGTVVDLASDAKSVSLSSSVSVKIENLTPATEYVIHAVGAVSAENLLGEVGSLEAATLPHENMLSITGKSKTGLSYRIKVEENETYQHTYIEGWFYDYMLALMKETEGAAFDMDVFHWQLLADFGYDGKGPDEYSWNAGDPNPRRGDVAMLIGGKKYYVIASLYNPEKIEWEKETQVSEVILDPAGESGVTMTVAAEELTPQKVRVRMEMDSDDVNFYFYDLYPKEQYDSKIEENGKEWMMDYVYEYGNPLSKSFSDEWETEPSTSYVLALFGVDRAGDVFYVEQQFDTPALKPEFKVQMRTYEREAENYFSYDCIKIDVEAVNFVQLNAGQVSSLFMPKAVLEATLDMLGYSIDMMIANPEYALSIGAQPLSEEEAQQLQSESRFTSIYPELEASTEYCYFIMAPDNEGGYVTAYATASTDAEPEIGDPEPEYLAFLGDWTVTGQSTEDYSSPMVYDISIEQSVANRSFKIYGWGHSACTKEMPIIARYDSAVKKMFIDEQNIGIVTIDGMEKELVLNGLYMKYGELAYLTDYSGGIYEAKCNGDRLSMFPVIFTLDGMSYEFSSMSYFVKSEEGYELLPGERYYIVNFTIDRKK